MSEKEDELVPQEDEFTGRRTSWGTSLVFGNRFSEITYEKGGRVGRVFQTFIAYAYTHARVYEAKSFDTNSSPS